MTKFDQKAAHEWLTLLESGACSSVELCTELLEQIRARDPAIHAYVDVDEEKVLAQAHAADAARAAGKAGALLGLPVGLKDIFNAEGDSCRCASQILKGYTAPYDATCVAKIKASGGVLAGRLNMDEFAMGSSTENSVLGLTHNPWNTDCVPGGSSGGCAAAIAAGTALATLGTDTGGSIRQPASFCGCVGLKPTYGRVSRYGVTAYASSLDQVGPITSCVRDAALMLSVLAGHDERDSTSVPCEVPNYLSALQTDLKGRVLGLPKEYFVEGLHPETRAAIEAAVQVFRDLGAEVREVSLPNTRYAVATYYLIATAEASTNLARFDGIRYGQRVEGDDPVDTHCRSRAAGFGTEVKRRIILGTYALSSGYYDAYYLKAQKVRTLIRQDFDRAFEQCDALITPVTPAPAFKIGELTEDPLQMYLSDIFTVTANLAGVCGLSLPCGFSTAGLPLGMQLLGPAFAEDRILNVGHAYEQATTWSQRHPEL